ncbi:hypothetical protein [Saccharopolyspora sp. CA-218241]|uniref:hypothetical protein n=1 Tax=Saccharopolyspora sp. CA-218241 TaxID=3240027 RepID=UPI003D98C743
MSALRTVALISVLGGLVATVLLWSHSHPHEIWSVWSLVDVGALVLSLVVLRKVNRRVSAEPPSVRLAAVLGPPRRTR